MIIPYILLALFSGMVGILARSINAKLGSLINPAGASLWNHLTGSVVMAVIVAVMNSYAFKYAEIPYYAYLGGFIGALYVTISNFVVPKIGAAKATVMMIGGQVFTAAIIDYFRGVIKHPLMAVAGTALIIIGVYIGEKNKT